MSPVPQAPRRLLGGPAGHLLIERIIRSGARASSVHRSASCRTKSKPHDTAFAPALGTAGVGLAHSKEIAECLGGESCIFCDPSHCEGIDWISAWDCQAPFAVTHHDMPALPDHGKSGLFEGANSIFVRDAWNFRHGSWRSNGDEFPVKADSIVCQFSLLILCGDFLPKSDGLADIRQSFLACSALTPASRQRRTAYRKAFLALDQFH